MFQGRKKLPNAGWAISNAARSLGYATLLFWQKLGGQIPTLPTRQLRLCVMVLRNTKTFLDPDHQKLIQIAS